MRKIYCIMIVFCSHLLGACSLAPAKPVGSIYHNDNIESVVNLVVARAKTCWEQEPSLTNDGITVNVWITSSTSYTLFAARYASDIGVQPAFLAVNFTPVDASTTELEFMEGDYACWLQGCYTLNYTSHVKAWLSGEEDCIED